MHVLTVSRLTQDIKKQLEAGFASVSVQGEVSNCKLQSSGHYYFTLKDSFSQISCVLFKGQTKTLSSASGMRTLKDGDKIVLHGEISVYVPRGTYQIIVKSLDFVGTGDLLLRLHQLKAKLEAEGLFDPKNKQKIPNIPKTIGVVTSPTGAVIQDILHVLTRRSKGFHLILNPVKVQGEGAALEIAKAIDEMNRYKLCDVMIVGRGGGSLEDLWSFNEEVVVQAVARSKIPIISAVGHETDVCLCDFAADVRAPTPSAAAEICTAEKAMQITSLKKMAEQVKSHLYSQIKTGKRQLFTLSKSPLLSSPKNMLFSRMQDIDEQKEQLIVAAKNLFQKKRLELLAKQKQSLALKPSNQIKNNKDKLAYCQKSILYSFQALMKGRRTLLQKKTTLHDLYRKISTDITQKKKALSSLVFHLEGVSPKNLLKKGYCILFSEKNDSVILTRQDISIEDRLRVVLSDGQIHVKVEAKQ